MKIPNAEVQQNLAKISILFHVIKTKMQHSAKSKCDPFAKHAKLKRDEKREQLLLDLIWNFVKNVDCGIIFSKQPSMKKPALLLFFRTFKVPSKFT